jgi:isoprenylcysteine carboxyl methyltransferase (ICMT) family protein YpbQ
MPDPTTLLHGYLVLLAAERTVELAVTAALATLGNVLLLAIRIPAEERALGLTWARAFGRAPVAGGRP